MTWNHIERRVQFKTRPHRRSANILGNALLLFLMVSFCGCNFFVIWHDEDAAAREATRFGETVFVKGDVESGYKTLAWQTRRSISLEKFEEAVLQMHPQSKPNAVLATDFEMIPGQNALYIYLFGKNGDENFYYRLTMIGTKLRGYQVAGVFRDVAPYPPSEWRHSLNGSVKQVVDYRYPPKLPREEVYVAPAREQKLWALATCALLTEVHRERHDILGGRERTVEGIRREKKSLAEWWGIENREDLLKSLQWIEYGGHRRDFDGMGRYVATLSDDQFVRVENQAKGDVEKINSLEAVRLHHAELGGKSIAGWDYARYIALCEWGYYVGYLSEDEAWAKIMPAARLLQQAFDSWEDLGRNYLIGRRFWSYRQFKRSGLLFTMADKKLRTDPMSPWKTIPWNLELGPAHATPDSLPKGEAKKTASLSNAVVTRP